jgi:hypothetical protein
MRIRTVKPEFWQSASMASVSRDARLVGIALLNYADDDGIFLANDRVFRGALFPFDDDLNIENAFRELSWIGFVAFAEHSGKILGKIMNFRAHQRIDKPQKSRFNAENAVFACIPRPFQECSGNLRGLLHDRSDTEVEVEVEVEVEKEVDAKSVPSLQDWISHCTSKWPDWPTARIEAAWHSYDAKGWGPRWRGSAATAYGNAVKWGHTQKMSGGLPLL